MAGNLVDTSTPEANDENDGRDARLAAAEAARPGLAYA